MDKPRRGHRLRWLNRACTALGLVVASPLVAPQLLAFPHQARIASHIVYSEQPIGPAVEKLVRDADARMLASPLGRARPLDQSIFLTDGGWRWKWLAISASNSFAISRPLGEPVIVNRSEPALDLVRNRRLNSRTRALSDVLVHELTHGAIRARFGIVRSARMPTELVEGYADHVAGSSGLTDAEAEAMLRSGERHPALVYWTGRKKVERALARNGGDVTRLFEEWR